MCFFGIPLRQSAFWCDFPGRYRIFISYSCILSAHLCSLPAESVLPINHSKGRWSVNTVNFLHIYKHSSTYKYVLKTSIARLIAKHYFSLVDRFDSRSFRGLELYAIPTSWSSDLGKLSSLVPSLSSEEGRICIWFNTAPIPYPDASV